MTNVPTQVRAVLDVDLPRPRQLEDLIENDAPTRSRCRRCRSCTRRR